LYRTGQVEAIIFMGEIYLLDGMTLFKFCRHDETGKDTFDEKWILERIRISCTLNTNSIERERQRIKRRGEYVIWKAERERSEDFMYVLSPEKFQLIKWPAYLGKAGLQALPFPRRQLFYSMYYVRDNQSLERCRELAAYLLYRFSSGGDISQRIRRKIIPFG
jgi:hypothetical protein